MYNFLGKLDATKVTGFKNLVFSSLCTLEKLGSTELTNRCQSYGGGAFTHGIYLFFYFIII